MVRGSFLIHWGKPENFPPRCLDFGFNPNQIRGNRFEAWGLTDRPVARPRSILLDPLTRLCLIPRRVPRFPFGVIPWGPGSERQGTPPGGFHAKFSGPRGLSGLVYRPPLGCGPGLTFLGGVFGIVDSLLLMSRNPGLHQLRTRSFSLPGPQRGVAPRGPTFIRCPVVRVQSSA